MRVGVYPGTFDPITNGHRDIIARALRVVDKLIIGVAHDTGKEPVFAPEQRAELVRHDVLSAGISSSQIEVYAFSGLLVDFAKAHDAQLLVRGLRAVSDFEYEFQMACINSKLAPELETIFLTASEETHFVSSRFVKQVARLGGNIDEFVSPNVAQHLQQYFAQSAQLEEC